MCVCVCLVRGGERGRWVQARLSPTYVQFAPELPVPSELHVHPFVKAKADQIQRFPDG